MNRRELFQTLIPSQRIRNATGFSPAVVGMQPARKTFVGPGPYQFTTNFPLASFQAFKGSALLDLGVDYTYTTNINTITINISLGSAKLTIFYWN